MGRFRQRVASELTWAWRNLRARGWRAPLAIALLGAALAANTLVVAAADSLVFNRLPYRDVGRLVEIQRRSADTRQPGSSFLSAALLDEWRKQTDLLEGVQGHLSKVVFLTASRGEPELVRTTDVTVGLVELLGVRPRWGRSLQDGDQNQLDPQPVLIAQSLATERFADPARAVGQRLETTAAPLLVVGVMPAEFRFPVGTSRIWRALDPRGPLARGFAGISSIARIRSGLAPDLAAKMLAQRSAAVGRAAGASAGYAAMAAPLSGLRAAETDRRMFFVLIGAAWCLLLIACANVASLELAGAVVRARTYAIQLAVGASRASLARTALAEGALLAAAATGVASVIMYAGAAALAKLLPVRLSSGSANPIDLDGRAFVFMLAAGLVAWALAALPVVVFAARASLLELLKLDGPTSPVSFGGTRLRRALTVAEIALAVLLAAGSVLYVRTYLKLIEIDKGFDSTGVAVVTFTIPPQLLGSGIERAALAQQILDRFRALPGVLGAFQGSPPPDTGDSPTSIEQIEVDDRPPADTDLRMPRLWVDPDYFKTLRIPLVAGRMFEPGDPMTNVIISDGLARRLWPDGNAVGHRYRESPTYPWKTVIGVVRRVRLLEDGTTGPRNYFQTYVLRPPPPPPSPNASRARDGGPSYGFLTVTARVDSRARAGDLYRAARALEPRHILKVEFADDQYTRQFEDRLLAARIITAFGALALVLAAAGIYGLMTFLVAGRTREIGIRMALGASRADINRLITGSALRLVVAGALLGVAGALALSRWIQSQLFGVRGTDAATLTLVALGVIGIAIVATRQPARQAGLVDPKVLMKN
jgi:predicted permease